VERAPDISPKHHPRAGEQLHHRPALAVQPLIHNRLWVSKWNHRWSLELLIKMRRCIALGRAVIIADLSDRVLNSCSDHDQRAPRRWERPEARLTLHHR
jgi:hypothetical protein